MFTPRTPSPRSPGRPAGPGVEIDVRRSRSGELVVIHDAVEQSERGRADLSSSGVSLAYLADLTPRTDVRTARRLGCSYVHANGWLCLCTGVVRRARDIGVEVNAWTANWRLEARLLA